MRQRLLMTVVITVLCIIQVHAATAESNQVVDHIVFLWLKQPGNIHAQDTVIKASQALKTIPGVISLRVGKPASTRRKVVDSSYDVALIIRFTDKAALDAYVVHPTHKKLLKEIMQPLVNRIKVYDVRS